MRSVRTLSWTFRLAYKYRISFVSFAWSRILSEQIFIWRVAQGRGGSFHLLLGHDSIEDFVSALIEPVIHLLLNVKLVQLFECVVKLAFNVNFAL